MRLLAALLLAGCASPLVAPVERADRAAEDRIAQVERASRDLLADADRRAEARVTQVREELSDEIGALVEDFDERITAHRTETLAQLKAEREAIVSAFREESAAWRAVAESALSESAKWRETLEAQSARWEAAVRPAVETIAALKLPAPASELPAGPGPGTPSSMPPWLYVGIALFVPFAWGRLQAWRKGRKEIPEKS